jgi:hypothetical protein
MDLAQDRVHRQTSSNNSLVETSNFTPTRVRQPHVQRVVLKIPSQYTPCLNTMCENSKSGFGVHVHGSLNNE